MKKLLCAILLCSVLIACNSSSEQGQEPRSTNVLKEYVDVPKDRAKGAKDKIEGAQNALQRQADGLDSE